MKALILTCRFGMGHYSVSDSIEKELKKKGYDTLIVDLMDYIYPFASKSIYLVFEYMVKHQPNLYNMASSRGNGDKPPFKMYGLIRMKKLIKEFNANIIISTFPVCASYASNLKDHYNKDVKLYTYITDFFPSKEWISKNTDIYFVASFDTKNILIKEGISEDKIVVSGIPVREEFMTPTKKKIGKKILIMGGGLGIIPEVYDIIEKLIQLDGAKITVITGSNQVMYQKLKEKYNNIEIIGFTDKMYEYLSNANLLITKPGGITVFEAIRTNTPLCIIKPFLKQEMVNAKFIVENSMGIEINVKSKDFNDRIEGLFKAGTIEKIEKNMKTFTKKLEPICPDKYY